MENKYYQIENDYMEMKREKERLEVEKEKWIQIEQDIESFKEIMDRGGDISGVFKKFIDKKGKQKKLRDDKQSAEFKHLLDNLDIK